MKTNEWGVQPGTQDNILLEDMPGLSENECSLVNLFRAVPEGTQKMIMQAVMDLVRAVHESEG